MNDSKDACFSRAVRVMYGHIGQACTLDDIAKKAHMSLASMKRLFQEALGQSPGAFMRRLRMEYAFRFSAAVSHITRDIDAERMNIKGGDYARFSYFGKPNNLGLAYHYIFGKWQQAASKKIAKDKPAFTMFEHIPDAMQEEYIMIYVPLVC